MESNVGVAGPDADLQTPRLSLLDTRANDVRQPIFQPAETLKLFSSHWPDPLMHDLLFSFPFPQLSEEKQADLHLEASAKPQETESLSP